MRISDRGLDLLRSFEGLRLKKYLDSAGKWTIGVGHLIKPDENFDAGIDQAQADSILRIDLMGVERCVSKAVTTSISQNEFDALVCLTFNIGCGALLTSNVLRFTNARDFTFAADGFLKWNKVRDPKTKELVASKGLTNRRAAERALYLLP